MRVRVMRLIAAALLGTASAASADGLAEAMRFYDEAMYTRALEVFDAVAVEQPSAAVHQYRALCLIALGRPEAAERAMADIVAVDPFFALDGDAASPRVAARFAAVRRRLLPPLIRRGFAEATASYRQGATARARDEFDRVLKLLADPALRDDQALADLALVASAFVELTRAQTPHPTLDPIARHLSPSLLPPSRPEPAGAGPAPPAPDASTAVERVTAAPARLAASPVAFQPAVAVERPLPRWMPPDARAAQRTYSGAITVDIDAHGRVVAAATARTIHPAYDPVVLAAARGWVFTPARQNGRPVKSEITVEIELLPADQ